jgi:hypothetical protein
MIHPQSRKTVAFECAFDEKSSGGGNMRVVLG